MDADDVRTLIDYLGSRVRLEDAAQKKVMFDEPSEREMIDSGVHPDAVRQVLAAPWWREMIEDVAETPAFCDPEENAEQVLAYARDVPGEYVRKRFKL